MLLLALSSLFFVYGRQFYYKIFFFFFYQHWRKKRVEKRLLRWGWATPLASVVLCKDKRQLSLTSWAALDALFPLPDYMNRQKHFFYFTFMKHWERFFSCVIIQFAKEIKAAAGESWRCFVNFKVARRSKAIGKQKVEGRKQKTAKAIKAFNTCSLNAQIFYFKAIKSGVNMFYHIKKSLGMFRLLMKCEYRLRIIG